MMMFHIKAHLKQMLVIQIDSVMAITRNKRNQEVIMSLSKVNSLYGAMMVWRQAIFTS